MTSTWGCNLTFGWYGFEFRRKALRFEKCWSLTWAKFPPGADGFSCFQTRSSQRPGALGDPVAPRRWKLIERHRKTRLFDRSWEVLAGNADAGSRETHGVRRFLLGSGGTWKFEKSKNTNGRVFSKNDRWTYTKKIVEFDKLINKMIRKDS